MADVFSPFCLSCTPSGVGNFVRTTECAFFHKRSRTLLVTDACIYINDKVWTLIKRRLLGSVIPVS